MSNRLHPILIKANIALYQGERAEALRLIRQYENERPATDDPHRSLVLWLEAQTHTDDTMRDELLHDLINKLPIHDEYAQMAREYLQAQNSYRVEEDRSQWIRPARWVAIGATVLAGFVILGLVVFSNQQPTDNTDTTALFVTATPPPALPPDRSRPLVAQSFTLRYDRGILQLLAIEDQSERVVDRRSGTLLNPVAGARFFVLEIDFECRSGICNAPPEAEITLRTDSDDIIPLRDDAGIFQTEPLVPVALGRATSGWLVFEVPALSRPEVILVKPFTNDTEVPPLEIELP